mgnify:CR=1 FL=1
MLFLLFAIILNILYFSGDFFYFFIKIFKISIAVFQKIYYNIVVANRVEAGKPFLMKAGALALIMKRNVMVEMDRDITTFSTKFAVSDHYVPYVKYADRIVKFETTPGK